MADYVRKTDAELEPLTDEELVEAIAAARDAGDLAAARHICGMLAFRHWGKVLARVKLRTPRADAEDVAMTVMESVVRSAFDGKQVGRFHAWVAVITNRRIADYTREKEGKPTLDPLPDEHEGDEDFWVRLPQGAAENALLPYREIAERIRSARPNPIHQHVIRLYGPLELNYLDLGAAATATEITRLHPGERVSEANVHQIWRRFKAELADALRAAEEVPG